jgi:lysophospholipase L1-like esterase
MYGPGGQGEACQVYELGVPGTTLADILERFEPEVKARLGRSAPEDTYIILSAGSNDSKAVDAIDNYPFSPEDFAASVHSFIHLAKDYSRHIIGVGLTPVDEAKTSPKQNPLTGGQSFFTNTRLQQFEAAFQQTCEAEGAQFIPLFANVPADWTAGYLFTDGIHPNQQGHDWIFSQVSTALRASGDLFAEHAQS